MIPRFRYRHCADPRDRVFALLGLAYPEDRGLVDYTLDKKQVYTALVRYNMRLRNSLYSLIRVFERDRDTSLPSWVPDFETVVFDDPGAKYFWMEFNYMSTCTPLFSAGMRRMMELGASKEDQLQLGGRKVDSIRRICKGPPQAQWQNGFTPSRADWRALLESEHYLDSSSYPSGGTYAQAFWRTCTCDIHEREDMEGQCKRIAIGDEERIKNKLENGAFGIGISPMTTFFISTQGYIGMGPEDTQVGDEVYVLFGGCVPFILRERLQARETSGSHTFVGHAYVHGIMDGEILEKDIPDEQVILE